MFLIHKDYARMSERQLQRQTTRDQFAALSAFDKLTPEQLREGLLAAISQAASLQLNANQSEGDEAETLSAEATATREALRIILQA